MAEVDPARLPSKYLVDTGVLIRALGQFSDEDAEVCQKFFDAMIEHRRRMLVAAPTLAEMLRGKPAPLPRTRSVVVVAFDSEAAQILGLEMPVSVLKAQAKSDGLTHTYMKFDAMIVACAKRWEAECIVALDGDHVRMASSVDMEVRHPKDFLERQTVLSLFERESSEG